MKRVLWAMLLVAGCSSSTNGRPDGSGNGNGDGGGVPLVDLGADAFYLTDPPAMACDFDGGVLPPPPPPGGSLDCPDDKNREGCACPAEGMMAACWPGLRANRNLGICKDGMTTCTKFGELSLAWGPCVGYRLPTPGAMGGANACECFSHGAWKLDNLSPCFFAQSGMPQGSGGAISTVPMGTMYQCPADLTMTPAMPWANDTVTADCAGHFKLCYTLKAGDGMNPMATDCVVSKVCSEGNYTTVNLPQMFPPLPGWLSTTNTACTQQFATTGGYGEMSVDGKTATCGTFSRVFNHVTYCPLTCTPGSTDPKCANCMGGGSGMF